MVDPLLNFIDLIHQLQLVKRAVLARGEERFENDLEHSATLAMVGWYLATRDGVDLDIDHVIALALAHDVVEAYAGDTPLYSGDREAQRSREEAARQTLRDRFPEFAELHAAIDEYENRETREAKFVYALDKLLPVLINYQDGGRNWKLHGITLGELMDRKSKDIALSPEVEPYYKLMLERLRRTEGDFFRATE